MEGYRKPVEISTPKLIHCFRSWTNLFIFLSVFPFLSPSYKISETEIVSLSTFQSLLGLLSGIWNQLIINSLILIIILIIAYIYNKADIYRDKLFLLCCRSMLDIRPTIFYTRITFNQRENFWPIKESVFLFFSTKILTEICYYTQKEKTVMARCKIPCFL